MDGHEDPGTGTVVIDDGYRRWYEDCPCCMSQAEPEIKRMLDEERRTARRDQRAAGADGPAEAGS